MHLHRIVHYCILLATLHNGWCSLFLQAKEEESCSAPVEDSALFLDVAQGSVAMDQTPPNSAAAETWDIITMCSETSWSVITLVLSLNWFSFSNKFPCRRRVCFYVSLVLSMWLHGEGSSKLCNRLFNESLYTKTWLQFSSHFKGEQELRYLVTSQWFCSSYFCSQPTLLSFWSESASETCPTLPRPILPLKGIFLVSTLYLLWITQQRTWLKKGVCVVETVFSVSSATPDLRSNTANILQMSLGFPLCSFMQHSAVTETRDKISETSWWHYTCT